MKKHVLLLTFLLSFSIFTNPFNDEDIKNNLYWFLPTVVVCIGICIKIWRDHREARDNMQNGVPFNP